MNAATVLDRANSALRQSGLEIVADEGLSKFEKLELWRRSVEEYNDYLAAAFPDAVERALSKETKPMDLVNIAKRVEQVGPAALEGFSKADFYQAIAKRAETERNPGETSAQAFARIATTDDDGRALFKAHRLAAGVDFAGAKPQRRDLPPSSPALQQLDALAAAERRKNAALSREQAFAKCYTDPANRDLVQAYKRERRVV